MGSPRKNINRKAPFYLEVAKGNIEGHSLIQKFGAGNVTTSFLPVTQGNVYKTPTAAVSLEIVSSDAADAQNGVGARKITVIGLDANWNEITEEVSTHATNGTTAVELTNDFIRVYRWYVSESGAYATESTGSHAGTLTLRVAGAGATWSTIGITPFPVGQSQIGVYTIPTGKTGYLLSKNIFTDSTKAADVYFFQRPLANDVVTPFTGVMKLIEREVGVTGGYNLLTATPKGPFVGPCDVGFMAKVTSGTAEIAVEFELLLIDN